MKRVLRDIPTSLLVMVGLIILLSLSSYAVTFVHNYTKLMTDADKELYKNNQNFYLYNGEAVKMDGGGVSSDGYPIDIEKAYECFHTANLNVMIRLYMPFEDVLYMEGDVSKGSDTLDIIVASKDKRFVESKVINGIYLNRNYDDMVVKGKINIADMDYEVYGRYEGKTSGMIVYNKLDEDNKKNLSRKASEYMRVRVVIGDDVEIDKEEIDKLKTSISAAGMTLMETKEDTNTDEADDQFVTQGMEISLFGLLFTVITLYMIVRLWFYKKEKDVAIMTCYGKSKNEIFVFLYKEALTLYVIAAIIYVICYAISVIVSKDFIPLVVPGALLLGLIGYSGVLVLIYDQFKRKMNMIGIINTGVN